MIKPLTEEGLSDKIGTLVNAEDQNKYKQKTKTLVFLIEHDPKALRFRLFFAESSSLRLIGACGSPIKDRSRDKPYSWSNRGLWLSWL